jgi:uncharacterized spore protein YtfJ
MSDKPFFFETTSSAAETASLIGRLFDAVKPEAVFSKPHTEGDYTVITASEITVGMGAGFGGGGGTEPSSAEDGESASGYGGGGGGGGSALARPVAAIIFGPKGVRVEPIVDPTKIAIAFFTTLISIFAIVGKARKAMRAQTE